MAVGIIKIFRKDSQNSERRKTKPRSSVGRAADARKSEDGIVKSVYRILEDGTGVYASNA